MRRLSLFIALIAVPIFTFSQEISETEYKAKIKTDKLIEKYKLTADQSERVYQIYLKSENKIEPIRQEIKRLKREKKRLENNRDADLREVLNDEQWETYIWDRKEKRQKS